MEYLKWKTEVDNRLSKYFSQHILNKYKSSYTHLYSNNRTPQKTSDYLYEYINDSEMAGQESWFD
ncbi:MAG: hypothetical protein FWJ34_00620 [Geminocystis sp. GBBB08]|nr:hypothetical protein [Geminocystis sp. GBBB08]